MAIRNSKKERYKVKGSVEFVRISILKALKSGGFTNVKEIGFVNQITASYKTMTVWGSISLIMFEEGEFVIIDAEATANIDNIYALFSSPTKKILAKFKQGL